MHTGKIKCKLGKPPNYLARVLRQWRAKNGWPLKKVAAEFGVTEATWSRWESGDRFPEHELILLLSDFVQIPVCRFFCMVETRCPISASPLPPEAVNRTRRDFRG